MRQTAFVFLSLCSVVSCIDTSTQEWHLSQAIETSTSAPTSEPTTNPAPPLEQAPPPREVRRCEELVIVQVDADNPNPTVPPPIDTSVNTILGNPPGSGCSDPPTAINIAPATAGELQTPGASTTIEGTDVFGAILSQVGINACETDPASFCDEMPGVIDVISGQGTDVSGVLNAGGARVTVGYYINYFKCDQTYEYFVLFSYDKVGDNCAFELFLFGPIVRGADGTPTASPLINGLAINKDGCMLDAVPLNIAKEENYMGGDGETAVTPGVNNAGSNCRYCHAQGDTTPDRSRPFPWQSATIGGEAVPAYEE